MMQARWAVVMMGRSAMAWNVKQTTICTPPFASCWGSDMDCDWMECEMEAKDEIRSSFPSVVVHVHPSGISWSDTESVTHTQMYVPELIPFCPNQNCSTTPMCPMHMYGYTHFVPKYKQLSPP
eukprot:8459102-Ditylum_brightwellii.AAC.1